MNVGGECWVSMGKLGKKAPLTGCMVFLKKKTVYFFSNIREGRKGKEELLGPNWISSTMGDHEEKSTKQEASFVDDFICVSEFSEIVGPVPLFCIPENAKGSFNIEKFVIRIMAVDYQNKGDPGAFVDDTQVVISEPTENAFAYVGSISQSSSTTPSSLPVFSKKIHRSITSLCLMFLREVMFGPSA